MSEHDPELIIKMMLLRIEQLEKESHWLFKKIDSLFDAIAHGDDEHRKWLKQKITDHFFSDRKETDGRES
jgi:hypothetical protein